MPADLYPLIVIAGPTGSGKSDLALTIARRFGGEIVNYDSLQVYRHFDIGTAKPSPAERVDVAHHLIDCLAPDEAFSAGEYARRAKQVLGEIAARTKLPILVGGTGFYLRALIEGLFPGPPRQKELRRRLEEKAGRTGFLHRLLKRMDPAAAERIHPNDSQKLIRAIEVCWTTRRPLTEWFGEETEPLRGFAVLKIGLNPPRATLYERLDRRCEQMFALGLVEEVQGILAMGYPPAAKPFESLGYRQALAVLQEDLSREEALTLTQRDTRRYAKRQWTWFRREQGMEWFEGFGADPEVMAAIEQRVGEFLLGPPAEQQGRVGPSLY